MQRSAGILRIGPVFSLIMFWLVIPYALAFIADFFPTGFITQFLTALHLTGVFFLFISQSKCKIGMLTFSSVWVHKE